MGVNNSGGNKRTGMGLGIDAGGTYTDSVLYDFTSDSVVAWSKAATTHDNYTIGIDNSLNELFGKVSEAAIKKVGLVALSTTLATNAIVENKGGRVGLILIGYDSYNVNKIGFEPKVVIRGKHSIEGEQREPLDIEESKKAIEQLLARGIDAFAVSSEIAVRNPEFEHTLKELIGARSSLPVVLGSELTGELNCIKRANSSYLNARLIPLVSDLLESVRSILSKSMIRAPIMVVKGDGTLMSEEVAKTNPIEMVLSGPAASSIGGAWLSEVNNACIVDIGGTTTDMAIIKNGFLFYKEEGVSIENFRTAIKTIDIHTFGLGGDSYIQYSTKKRKILVGPRRVVPLCWLASHYPKVLPELSEKRPLRGDELLVQPADFLLLQKDRERHDLHTQEKHILEVLRTEGPTSVVKLAEKAGAYSASLLRSDRLEGFGDILRSGLTPTDILNATGKVSLWNGDASRRAVELYAGRMGVTPTQFIDRAMDEFYRTLLFHLFRFLIKEDKTFYRGEEFPENLISHIFSEKKNVTLSARLKNPVVFIGAPAQVVAPILAKFIDLDVIVPDNYEVANAVGSITGGVCENVTILIRPYNEDNFVAYTPAELRYYESLDTAKREMAELAKEIATGKARRAGAKNLNVTIDVKDREATIYPNEKVYLETIVTARVNGVPSIVKS
jgi:N-methylhydantoinase A/oxoprolinase/acetone carboxylase beta subunit